MRKVIAKRHLPRVPIKEAAREHYLALGTAVGFLPERDPPEHIGVLFASYSVAPDNTLVYSKEGSWFFSRLELYLTRLGDRRWDFVKESDAIVELKPEGPPRVIINQDPARKALVASFAGKLRRVNQGRKYGFEDWAGKTVIPPAYEDARDFAEGLAPVSSGGKWGYIDNTGKMVIEPRFGFAMEFSGGLAAVQVGKDAGYIDNTGKVIIEPKYQFGYDFKEGKARVLLWNGTFRYIDRKGEYLP
jgi:hypothetical protein